MCGVPWAAAGENRLKKLKIMGKKKVIKQTEEELLKEKDVLEAAQKKAGQAISGKLKDKRIEKGRAYIHSSYNNIILTLTDQNGNVLAWASSGSLGFKGPKKATPFAASRVAEAIMEKVSKSGIRTIDVLVKGVGSGREATIRALASKGLEINSIKDVTPIPHNGCRPPKVRRV